MPPPRPSAAAADAAAQLESSPGCTPAGRASPLLGSRSAVVANTAAVAVAVVGRVWGFDSQVGAVPDSLAVAVEGVAVGSTIQAVRLRGWNSMMLLGRGLVFEGAVGIDWGRFVGAGCRFEMASARSRPYLTYVVGSENGLAAVAGRGYSRDLMRLTKERVRAGCRVIEGEGSCCTGTGASGDRHQVAELNSCCNSFPLRLGR